jgi:hypothetical protein
MNKILALALLFSLTTACTKNSQNNQEEKPDISFNAGFGVFTGSGDFGVIGPKDSKILTVKITNTGDAPLSGPAQIDNNKFSIIYQSGCTSINPGKVCTLKLSFSASGKNLGVHTANFNLDTAYLALTAEIVDPNINQTASVSFSANPLDFGTIKDNESLIKNLIITNTGVVNIQNQAVTVGPLYNKIYDTCSNKRILPTKTCLVKLQLVGTGKNGAINETLNFAGQPMSVVGVVVNSQGPSVVANPDVKFLINNVEASNYDYGSLSGKESKQVIIYAKNFGNNTSEASIANTLGE